MEDLLSMEDIVKSKNSHDESLEAKKGQEIVIICLTFLCPPPSFSLKKYKLTSDCVKDEVKTQGECSRKVLGEATRSKQASDREADGWWADVDVGAQARGLHLGDIRSKTPTACWSQRHTPEPKQKKIQCLGLTNGP